MTNRLEEIRSRAEAAVCRCYTVCEQDGIDCPMSYDWHELWREDIPYLLAENERLRAALGRIGTHCTGCGMQFGHPCEFGCITVNFWTYATPALTEGGES